LWVGLLLEGLRNPVPSVLVVVAWGSLRRAAYNSKVVEILVRLVGWDVAILVGVRLAGIYDEPHNHQDEINEWDEEKKYHPTTLSNIVHATNTNAEKGWDESKNQDR